jgi:DNA modification methylase
MIVMRLKEPSVHSESINGRNKRNDDEFCQSDPNGFARTRGGFSSIEQGRKYELRNKRSVWTVATQPYAEAHFATFPEDLIKPCILAGSRPGDTVLDPFGGSGTTGKVAIECGRRSILIELSPVYVAQARDRTNVTPGFF